MFVMVFVVETIQFFVMVSIVSYHYDLNELCYKSKNLIEETNKKEVLNTKNKC